MIRLSFVLFLFTICGLAYSQTNPQPINLSQNPSAQELRAIFNEVRKGEIDAFKALSAVTERGERGINGLRDLLTQGNSTADSLRKIRHYSVMALDAIGSRNSVNVLLQVASSHPDPEMRASALNAIASTYYERVIADTITPDKQIVRLLMQELDDTTSVEAFRTTISRLASKGLENWLGSSGYAGGNDSVRVKVGRATVVMSLPQYREHWWERVKNHLQWNADALRFRIQ